MGPKVGRGTKKNEVGFCVDGLKLKCDDAKAMRRSTSRGTCKEINTARLKKLRERKKRGGREKGR